MSNKENNLKIAQFAHKSLLYEVTLAPKPGLVDRFNNGSHDDMDIFTFLDAINALTPYLYQYTAAGSAHTGTPKELFQKARAIGCCAENAMMKATNNVNTHKGANFSLAVILSATAYTMKEKRLNFPLGAENTDKILKYVARMCQGLVAQDFQALDQKKQLSYGEMLFKQHGITGIRGVAEQGYPLLSNVAMPYVREQLKKYPEEKEGVFLCVLALLMSHAEDTNLIHRGGMASYYAIRSQAKVIFTESCPRTIREKLRSFDQQLIKHHLSPGGAADLLSLTLYVAQVEGLL